MAILRQIRYWWLAKFHPLKRHSTQKSDKDIQAIKSSHRIKRMFFEEYKNNPQYAQQDGTQENRTPLLFKGTRVTKIAPNVFYENISFWNVDFVNVTLENVCFHNCSFHFCKFTNMSTHTEKQLINVAGPKQGFSCCNFMGCEFSNCKLDQLFFSVGVLKGVRFIDSKFNNVVFQMNAFSQVCFEHNCDLSDFYIFSPSGMLDIQFRENGGNITIDDKSAITGFRYRDKTNIHNWNTYKIFKKSHYQNVAATYYAFEKLIDGNKLLDKKSCCFYQRKRAETRSKGFWKAIPGYLAEWCFGYGEYPGRSILSLIGVIFLYAPLYMLSGFSTGTRIINYTISFDFTITWDKFKDFCESVYFSFFTLVTVGQGTPSPIFALTKILSASELLLGAVLITTFTATLFRKITE